MIYQVTTNPTEINFNPSTTAEEILQNVYTIISTAIYSAPLFREFGMNYSFLDEPFMVAKAKMTAEIIEKVQKYETRVIVTKVEYEEEQMEGVLKPIVSIRIVEEVIT